MLRRAILLGLLAASATWALPSELAREVQRALAQAGAEPEAQVAVLEDLARRESQEACGLLAELSVNPRLTWQARDAGREGLLRQSGAEPLLWAADASRAAKTSRVRVLACQLLARLAGGEPRAVALLIPALDDEDPAVRAAAIAGLSHVREARVVGALVRCLQGSEGRVARDCVLALQDLTGERQPDAAAWASWWAAVGEDYAVPAEAAARAAAPAPARLRTVTRLEPPGSAGRTIYEEVTSSSVLFVVDVSFSMRVRVLDGEHAMTRLDYVKAELREAINAQLDDEDRFNVIAFSSGVTPWKPKLTKANARGKKSALKFVDALRPDADTNIGDALELAFLHDDVDTVYFLTDGSPTAGALTVGEEILAAVRAWNAGRGVRVHTVAFLAGDAEAFQVVENKGMATRFLQALAEQNQGTFSLFE